jgi:hypothetical protein
LVARLLWEQDVAGSNPAAPTSKINRLCRFGMTYFFDKMPMGQNGDKILTGFKA